MTEKPFRIERFAKQYNRSIFNCGVMPLDTYLEKQAGQDVKRRVTACFLLIDNQNDEIAGYYTLSAADIVLSDLPGELTKKLPRYPLIPVARIGRLAIDQNHHGKKLGAALLFDAAKRAATSDIAVYALAVDAKDEQAIAFYKHHGFKQYGSTPNQLIIPVETIKKLL